MTTPISIGTPYEPSASDCGYCSSADASFKCAGLQARQLSCGVYQRMIDRGWRRSGMYCYKPDMRRTCCPQYTIKLDALEIKPSKSQRKSINRWNRFVIQGAPGESMTDVHDRPKTFQKKSSKQQPSFSLITSIHASEHDFIPKDETSHHSFQVNLEPSSFTQEKFELFKQYQLDVHDDIITSPNQFIRFLVRSPVLGEPILYPCTPPSHLPLQYGSYHQMYRLNGKLIAMAVLDVLPNCVSSVYFLYDRAWEKFSFGKLSALREASLAREIHDAGVPGMAWLYMGFYIHSCQKMRYKGEYSPSYLADPETYTWFPLEECIPLLDEFRYACFSNPEHSVRGDIEMYSDEDDDAESDLHIPEEVLRDVFVVKSVEKNRVTIAPVLVSDFWYHDHIRRRVTSCIHALGFELARDVILQC